MRRSISAEPLREVPGEPLREEKTKARTAPAAEGDKAPEPVPWLLVPAAKGKTDAKIATRAKAPRRACGWLPRPFFSSSFPRPDGYKRLNKDPFRSALPGREERLAFHRNIVKDCLDFYNTLHPMNYFFLTVSPMNQLLKPTISLASLLGGVLITLATGRAEQQDDLVEPEAAEAEHGVARLVERWRHHPALLQHVAASMHRWLWGRATSALAPTASHEDESIDRDETEG
nr:unnamed protein product [Digitaria exilis]